MKTKRLASWAFPTFPTVHDHITKHSRIENIFSPNTSAKTDWYLMSERKKRMSFKCNLNVCEEEENVSSVPNSCSSLLRTSYFLWFEHAVYAVFVHAPFGKMSPNNDDNALSTHSCLHPLGDWLRVARGEAFGQPCRNYSNVKSIHRCVFHCKSF